MGNFGILVSVLAALVHWKVAAACVEREEKRPRGVLIPLYITDREHARLAVRVQLQLSNPGIWVRPLLIPFDSQTGRFTRRRYTTVLLSCLSAGERETNT